MASATSSAPITCTGATLQAVETDFLAVPWFEGEGPSAVGMKNTVRAGSAPGASSTFMKSPTVTLAG